MEIRTTPSLTFDDILLEPGEAGFLRAEIDLGTQFSRNIRLEAPLVSAPMDTVTESELAIALGEQGGIGIIHRNLPISDQAREVQAVKAAGYLVGAAVGSSEIYLKRVESLVNAGVDAIVIDSAHGYSKVVRQALRAIKAEDYPIDVIAGNVATAEGAVALIEDGADGLRVGMGPGAICTTRIVSGMGVPQLTAIINTAHAAADYGVPVIADGGINNSGDMVKAFAAGASSVMLGRLFAATVEAPGEVVKLCEADVPARFKNIVNGSGSYDFKVYRGMGSISAMQRGAEINAEDEFHGKTFRPGSVLVAEGVEGLVPCSGPLQRVTAAMLEGIRSGFYYTGALTIPSLWQTAVLSRITQASLRESHPHDLFVSSTAASYST